MCVAQSGLLKCPQIDMKKSASASASTQQDRATPQDRAIMYWLALPILAIDLLSKWYIIQTIELNQQSVPIAALYPYYKHTHIANTGAVFGSLQGNSSGIILSILAIVVIIGLMIYNQRLPTHSRKLRVALGLVLAGAAGNLIDRLINGHVTDFIDLDFSSIIPIGIANWYIFNIADMAIVAAVIYLAYLSFFEPEQIEGPPAAADDAEADSHPSNQTTTAQETILATHSAEIDPHHDQLGDRQERKDEAG